MGELYSVEDVQAIRDGSASRDNHLEPRKATTDFLSFPLATQIPFLMDCRSQLGANPDLLTSHSLDKIASLSKILEVIASVANRFEPKVNGLVEVHGLQTATAL